MTRTQELEQLCAVLYQVLGAYGAPARVLDYALAAGEGKPLPGNPEELLPFDPAESAWED